MTAARNIELKARCPDLAAARAAAERHGARFVRVEHQRDTFFHARAGRLKLRERTWREGQDAEDRSGAELIPYERSDTGGARESRYHVVPVIEPQALVAALGAALGIRGAVVKRRELWMWHNVRIHLDEVEGLGSFVEFEAVMLPGETDAEAHARVAALQAALGLADASIVPVAYADLLGL
ncbi:adenylyl cyclase CyaB, putative [Nannocystis exedens]|uniref:Adenylyl cyclase CyaB, putative n=1 Tax=Nannocystis exedens TaxID=54 RepID=A0A1I1Z8B1_9BACT|nr:class IV adenylate cyclase [Nannocystis exedens]PCC75106.1 adenylate cyclase [Nannocystis exedens]SFE27929.1 adenylyl cyclase CyaB, putative [Nannocystis exedens]